MTTVPGPKCQTSDPNVNWLILTLLHFLLKQKRKKREGESIISKRYFLTPLSKFFRRDKKRNLGNLDTKTHNSVMD